MRERTSSTQQPGYASSAKRRSLASYRCICRAASPARGAISRTAGLYTNLITSAVGITDKTLVALAEARLDHVQISIQDSDAASADHIAGYAGAFAKKRALAVEVARRKLLLTVNAVVHRANIDRIAEIVDLALALGASRIEIAHVQYYGWALKNRAALMPSHEQADRAAAVVEELRARHHGRIVIDAVVPDYYARYPKPCVGGWGRRSLNVTPAGKVLPCHAAESIAGLEFWNVRQRSLADIWANSPAFNAFRGTGWMKEPCATCPRRELDFGGCRCQAFALTGEPTATDPVCHLAPDHARVQELAAFRSDATYDYRRMRAGQETSITPRSMHSGGPQTVLSLPEHVEDASGESAA
jgi:pyrroloquinoline quinone biosynthesis protein E